MKATPLWTPSVKTVENLAMAKFMTEIDAARGLSRRSCGDLHAFSIREAEAFWTKAGDFWAS
jgi:hypothetical protein